MHQYKIFAQVPDHSFIEIAQAAMLEDAEAVLANHSSGMITDDGRIIQTKELVHESEALFKI